MKILMVDKFHWLFAGPERYIFDTAEQLRNAGHEVMYFSMADERNFPCPESKYFVSNISYKSSSPLYKLAKLPKILGKTIYSFESRRKMTHLLRDLKPDIAHLHMIDHQISPSILHALRDANVPTVQTIHDYKLVCPANGLFNRLTGEVCERCLHGAYYQCVVNRCTKGSLFASVLASAATYFHKAIGIYERNVDFFLASSDFLANKLADGGVPREKIRKCHLTTRLADKTPSDTLGDYIVYAGRVSFEKGVGTLVRAMAKLPERRLMVLGDGDDLDALKALAAELGADNVEFAGYVTGEDYTRRVAECRAMVLPSELYETCGLVVWEAYALHRPAIVARIGGIPEFVDHGETGYIFESGNVDDLAEKIELLYAQGDNAVDMGRRGRAKVAAICDGHYDRLMAIYEEAMSKHAK